MDGQVWHTVCNIKKQREKVLTKITYGGREF
jgi:hypothetical protein